jgi:hypothetical protein
MGLKKASGGAIEALAENVRGKTVRLKVVQTVEVPMTTKTFDDGVPMLKHLDPHGRGRNSEVDLKPGTYVAVEVPGQYHHYILTDGRRKWYRIEEWMLEPQWDVATDTETDALVEFV